MSYNEDDLDRITVALDEHQRQSNLVLVAASFVLLLGVLVAVRWFAFGGTICAFATLVLVGGTLRRRMMSRARQAAGTKRWVAASASYIGEDESIRLSNGGVFDFYFASVAASRSECRALRKLHGYPCRVAGLGEERAFMYLRGRIIALRAVRTLPVRRWFATRVMKSVGKKI
jgi:hypothetical protein